MSEGWSNGDIQQLSQYGDEEAATGAAASLTSANLQRQDELAVSQNVGHTGSTTEDAEMADAEGDDGMDDDMMDKISSSPSIDDGGYSLPHMWPKRSDSLSRTPMSSSSISQACGESSSPFLETPKHFPLRLLPEPIDKDAVQGYQVRKHHYHHQGEYLDKSGGDDEFNYDDEESDELSPLPSDVIEPYDEDYDLDYYSEDILGRNLELESNSDCDESVGLGLTTIPYESSEDDNDDYEIPYADDSRFVDSGWGGECLQELEDIDFEFVYALHTFVATVEGQANATKGDTMVLLDDSNSYWWLVRVVKDSSIGKSNS